MRFLNTTSHQSVTRTGKPGVNNFIIDEDFENGSEAQFYISEAGALHVGAPGKMAPAREGYAPKNAMNAKSLLPGTHDEIFNFGDDDVNDPLIWVLTESILLANNVEHSLSLVMLDGYMLVALRKGIVEFQTTDDGETAMMVRGKTRTPADLKLSSASSYEFIGLPPEDLRVSNSVHAIEIKRKRAKVGFDVSCKTLTEGTGLLDMGVYEDQDNEEEARILAEAEEKEARRLANEEVAARNAEKARLEAEELQLSDSVIIGNEGMSPAQRRKAAKEEAAPGGRSKVADAFLAAALGKKI